MTRKNLLITGAIAVGSIFAAAIAAGQGPVVNIGSRHGNLRAAQQAIVTAYQKIDQAQHDNKDELGGHAAKAKQHLMAADEELRAAADFANARH